MRFRVASIAAVLVLAVMAASRLAFAQAPARTVEVTDPQDGGRLMVFAGDTVQVRLRSTPGTGYSWQVAHVDTSVLALQGTPVFITPPQNIPGAEGHEVFNFLTMRPGSSTLQLAYSRPWEKGTAPAKVFTVDVIVHPASDRPMPQP